MSTIKLHSSLRLKFSDKRPTSSDSGLQFFKNSKKFYAVRFRELEPSRT
jgi:hypothetical protein